MAICLLLEAGFVHLSPIPCFLFYFCPNLARLPHYVHIVGYLNDFFMAGQANLFICTVFSSLGMRLGLKKKEKEY